MNCFPCFQRKSSNNYDNNTRNLPVVTTRDLHLAPPPVTEKIRTPQVSYHGNSERNEPEDGSTAKAFSFRELAMATKNFKQECLLGEGGFGKVFRGTFQSTGQIVAVRQLDRTGTQGINEFKSEVLSLSRLQHPNLVKVIGYCADGDQRLLLYEYIPSGSLKDHLFVNKKALDWSTRMKIAAGIAEGLEYLHEKASPPIIYRDLKSSNIFLDETNMPKLSDYGLSKLVQSGSKMHLSMAGYGYSAPESEGQGELTLKSDVYSFGVVLLELITGRRAFDNTRPTEEQNLVNWAQPFFSDPSRFPDMVDPLMRKQFPATSLNQAVGVAAMCLQEEPSVRPLISDIVAALIFLSMAPPEAPIPAHLASILSARNSTFSRPSVDISVHRRENVPEKGPHHQKSFPGENKNDEQDNDDESSDSDGSVSSDHYDDNFQEGNISYCGTRKSRDSDSDTSSGEGWKLHDRQVTINLRSDSNVKSEDGCLSPMHYDSMGISIMRSDEESDYEYSTHSSSDDSDSDADDRKH